MELKEFKISQLKQADYNPKTITTEELEGLKKSLQVFGLVDPIVINKDFTIIGGHQRVRTWQSLGHDTIQCVQLDLNKKEEKKLNVVLDSHAISGKYDYVKLDLILTELKLDTDYFELRLDQLIPNLGGDLDSKENDFNPEPPIDPITVLGDVYEMNEHRLVCGDSKYIDVVNVLVGDRKFDLIVTDPPYNVNYSAKNNDLGKWRNNKNIHVDIENDNMDDAKFYDFLLTIYKNYYNATKEGASIYVFHADSEGHNFRKALMDADFKFSQCLIWKKSHMVLGRNDYHWKHEPILYGWKNGASHQWMSDRKQTTILEFDKPQSSAEHPTMKPLNILGYLIGNSSKGQDIVGDFFLGSGSTLIACEQLNRVCYGIELSPNYCDVIVRRFIKFMKENKRKFIIKRNGKEIEYKKYEKQEG